MVSFAPGMSELIGRDVAEVGHGGEIIVTKHVAAYLLSLMNDNDGLNHVAADGMFMEIIGAHHIPDLNLSLTLAHVVPSRLKDRLAHFVKVNRHRVNSNRAASSSSVYEDARAYFTT
jgi:hypothetical protein